jgi:hypothetical protein
LCKLICFTMSKFIILNIFRVCCDNINLILLLFCRLNLLVQVLKQSSVNFCYFFYFKLFTLYLKFLNIYFKKPFRCISIPPYIFILTTINQQFFPNLKTRILYDFYNIRNTYRTWTNRFSLQNNNRIKLILSQHTRKIFKILNFDNKNVWWNGNTPERLFEINI